MTPEPVVVVGAGGFGRNVLDVIGAINQAEERPVLEVVGVLDDAPSEADVARLDRRGIRHLGAIDEWLDDPPDVRYVSGLGIPRVRMQVAEEFASRGIRGVAVVHPRAGVTPYALVGDGAVVLGGAQVLADAFVGQHVHLNANAMIGHDAVLEDHVSVNPGGTVSGRCHVGRGAMIGAGAVVLQGLTVGAGSIVGAAACVVTHVPAGLTVKGVPAR